MSRIRHIPPSSVKLAQKMQKKEKVIKVLNFGTNVQKCFFKHILKVSKNVTGASRVIYINMASYDI